MRMAHCAPHRARIRSRALAMRDADGRAGSGRGVFFAAMMPAMRAAASTSPLGAVPSITAAKASSDSVDHGFGGRLARGDGFSETSTMRAAPFSSRWESLLMPETYRPDSRRVAAATSFCRIRLSPIRKMVTCASARRLRSAGADKPAFGHHDARPSGMSRRQPQRHAEIGDEGLEIAVVDADQAARPAPAARSSSASSCTSTSASMPQRARFVHQGARRVVVHHGQDDRGCSRRPSCAPRPPDRARA